MKVSDLEQASRLVGELRQVREMAARFGSGEPLGVRIGDGARTREIVLAADYAARLRADLAEALAQREARLVAELAAIGVEAGR